MKTLADAWSWLTTAANWSGDGGIWNRLGQHLFLTGVCLLISCLIALPVALVLGHLGKGGALAVNISNIGRAVPTFAVLVLLLLTPIGGHGEWPTIIALVLFAVPPLLTNAYVGMREVDRDIVRAARGMGMTGRQLMLGVEVPLALPLILTGVRIAAVQLVATATLAALAAWRRTRPHHHGRLQPRLHLAGGRRGGPRRGLRADRRRALRSGPAARPGQTPRQGIRMRPRTAAPILLALLPVAALHHRPLPGEPGRGHRAAGRQQTSHHRLRGLHRERSARPDVRAAAEPGLLLHEDHLRHQPGDLRTGAGERPDRRRAGVRRHLRRLAERQEERRRRHPRGLARPRRHHEGAAGPRRAPRPHRARPRARRRPERLRGHRPLRGRAPPQDPRRPGQIRAARKAGHAATNAYSAPTAHPG